MDITMKRHLRLTITFILTMVMMFSSSAITVSAAEVYEANIPALYQYNYTKTICTIDGEAKSVKTSGCGATSASMAIRYYTGNTSQTPETLFTWAYANGYYYGDGLSHAAITALCSRYAVSCSWTSTTNSVITALKNKKPVIAHMGPGTFTSSGHYIVLTGYKIENGVEKVRVNDPNSSSRTGKYYNWSTITSEKRDTGADFGICSFTSATSKLTVSPALATTTITKGNSCNISGNVTSNYMITSVKGSIVNSSGVTVQTITIYPNSTTVYLASSNINASLKFGTLAVGSYKLQIKATDTSQTSKTSTKNFTVKAATTASTLKVSPTLAKTSITKGSSCNISGTATSNYIITKMVGRIVNSSGSAVQSVTIYPNTTSVALSGTAINANLKFGKLAKGSYKLQITATDASGKSYTSTKSFTIV